VKELKLKNGKLEIDIEKIQHDFNDKKYEVVNGNGSTKDNIKRFNELREELNQITTENVKLKNQQVDVKLLNKDIESCSNYIKKIKGVVGLNASKTGGNETDLQDIYKSISKLVSRENKR